jgi:hypothetical protein
MFDTNRDPARMVAMTICAIVAVAPTVDPQQIQGAFNFRDAYKRTVKPALEREAQLQSLRYAPTGDAFVSNPFREPRIDRPWMESRRLPAAEHLVAIVEHLKATPRDAPAVLECLAGSLMRLLLAGKITYGVPPRVSLPQVLDLITTFLKESSGGDRLERVMVALLRQLGQATNGWSTVECHAANADEPYDAICWRHDNTAAAVAEAKDQWFDLAYLRQLREEMRSHGARLGYYVTRHGYLEGYGEEIASFRKSSFATGESLLVLDVEEFASSVLLGADATDSLTDFLRLLGHELDSHSSTPDRQAFAQLLERL